MKKSITYLYIIALILIACVINIYVKNFSFNANNSAGVIVSAFSVMLTVLIGWNIYQLVDIKQTKSDIENLKKNHTIRTHQLNVDIFSSVVGICKCQIIQNEENNIRKVEFLMLMNYLRLIYHKIQLKDIVSINEQISMMFSDIEKRKPIEVTNKESIYLHQITGDILKACKDNKITLELDICEIFN